MHLRHGNRNRPAAFHGRSSRVYDIVARRLVRGAYRGLAADLAQTAPRSAAVLDVGTGPGVLLMELGRRRPDLALTGVDLSADMIATAERNLQGLGYRAAVRTADVTDLPFPDGSFDLIVSSLSLHHWDDVPAAAGELARVLRPGGRLQIYDFRFAPFDDLATAAAAADRFAGRRPQRDSVRTRALLLPRLVRFTLQAAS
jgi:ubiquinone/menaquinone biosynthesis C-methylase UbiE